MKLKIIKKLLKSLIVIGVLVSLEGCQTVAVVADQECDRNLDKCIAGYKRCVKDLEQQKEYLKTVNQQIKKERLKSVGYGILAGIIAGAVIGTAAGISVKQSKQK